jgi:4-carboxymuconolactone decarboxylase
MPATPTFGRYAEIPYEQMTPEQQEAYPSLVETRGALGGPNRIWVHNPRLAKAAGPLGAHFNSGGYSLTQREREIAVCIINSKWHSAYRIDAHEKRGKRLGCRLIRLKPSLQGCKLHFRTSASESCTRWRWFWPIRAGSHRACTTERSRHSTTSASPT